MCLYPRFMRNKRYLETKKNHGRPSICHDFRMMYVPVGCGNCIECRKQKARSWQIRLTEEMKIHKYAYFITYSFSPESLQKLTDITKSDDCNVIATKAVRMYLERWRKKYKKSQIHWFVTELGQENTERIHIHGIIFTEEEHSQEELQKIWSYGNVYVGEYCSLKTINYIVKYITKIDEIHKLYKSIVLSSPGLGKNYLKSFNAEQNKYRPHETREYYTLPNGTRVNLPIYYRNYIYTEEERIKLWKERLDKQEIWVRGIKCDMSTQKGKAHYYNVLKTEQKNNEKAGYGSVKWKLKDYKITTEMLNANTTQKK